ncbi:synaptojanin-1 isoform X2 [Nilaparvata lugens]|nr:synaptojanin-1 isoform X2 [Nilaparvata lugens]
MVTGLTSVGELGDGCTSIYRITQTTFIPLRGPYAEDEKISDLRKLLSSGMFYFSWSPSDRPPADITMCAQRRTKVFQPDNRFMWNRTLHIPFIMAGIKCDVWLLKVICGSVEIRTVFVGSRKARAIIFSRICLERAGTRFSLRGLNDEGFVANFVETEQMIVCDRSSTSFVQLRGSVPIFWEQPGIKVGSHKVRISREFLPTVIPFQKHVMDLKEKYGHQVFVNLLSNSLSKEGEALLSQAFETHHSSLPECKDIFFVSFDYLQESRAGALKCLNKLKTKVDNHMQAHGFFFVHWEESETKYENKCIQYGTIRTNGLDCLDRTNTVQSFFGLETLEKQLDLLGLLHSQNKNHTLNRFREVFTQLWAANGNELSKFSTGSGNSGSSMLMDVSRSAAKTVRSNLLDTSKQEAIDLLLGNAAAAQLADKARCLLSPSVFYAPNRVLREMITRTPSYSRTRKLRISVGTYNVNGGKHFRSIVFKSVSLADWLLDCHKTQQQRCADPIPDPNLRIGTTNFGTEIFAIGVQEIVDLNAANIVSASSKNAKEWAQELLKVISRDEEYTILTHVQLVGVCLFIFVKPHLVQHIRDVDVDSVKTGLGGATGNKGAVAVRFTVYNSSVAFVCAHFAAGQSQVAERNADFAEITRKMSFSGRSLNCHDYVFWCGDFNYRVDMSREDIMKCLNDGKRQAVFAHDQLQKEQRAWKVFSNFLEGPIDFDPTYKYDLFCVDYDTSDKQRSPAWTDRVLWRRKKQFYERDAGWSQGRCMFYGRAELVQSDHRPVISIIEIDIQEIDKLKRSEVFAHVIDDLGPPDATIIIHALYSEEECFTDDYVSAVAHEFSVFGEVLFVRHVGFNKLLLTLRDGQAVLAACKKRLVKVCGVTLHLSYTASRWNNRYLKQINICSSKTGAMNSYLRPLWICEFINQQEDDATEGEAIASTSAVTDEPLPVQAQKSVEPYLLPIRLQDLEGERQVEELNSDVVYEEIEEEGACALPPPPYVPLLPPPLPPVLRRLPPPVPPRAGIPPPIPPRQGGI